MAATNLRGTAGGHPAGDPDDRWTSLNIGLHWLVVALLVLQFIDHEWMVDLFRASRRGIQVDTMTTAFGWGHMVIGGLIFIAAGIRLWDRFAHGRPSHPEGEPNWARTLASVTHFCLYALLLGMPVAGALAWFLGNHTIGDLHGWAWTALLILVALHVAGALANHFWFKTPTLRRIMPGHGR